MTFGEWLQTKRKEHGLRQVDLAGQLGITPVYLSRLETDTQDPSAELLRKALLRFDVTGGDFDTLFEQFRGEKTDRKFRDLEKRVRKLEALVYRLMADRLTGEMPT